MRALTDNQVMDYIERYFELTNGSMRSGLSSAGRGRSDSHDTGGVDGVLLFQCEVGAALNKLTRLERDRIFTHYAAWCLHAKAQKRAMDEGASSLPGTPHHREAEKWADTMLDLRSEPAYFSGMQKLKWELGERLTN